MVHWNRRLSVVQGIAFLHVVQRAVLGWRGPVDTRYPLLHRIDEMGQRCPEWNCIIHLNVLYLCRWGDGNMRCDFSAMETVQC